MHNKLAFILFSVVFVGNSFAMENDGAVLSLDDYVMLSRSDGMENKVIGTQLPNFIRDSVILHHPGYTGLEYQVLESRLKDFPKDEAINRFMAQYSSEFLTFAKEAGAKVLKDESFFYHLAKCCDTQLTQDIKSEQAKVTTSRGPRRNSFSSMTQIADRTRRLMLMTIQEQAYIGFSQRMRNSSKEKHIRKYFDTALEVVSMINTLTRDQNLVAEGILLSTWIIKNKGGRTISEEQSKRFSEAFSALELKKSEK